jgi:DNA polymerase-3 subunit alpha
MEFAHLRVHTDYSRHDSLVRISDLSSEAVSKNHKAIAVTDDANIFNAVKFYEKTRGQGVKPIVGAEIHINSEYGEDILPVLCTNQDGFKDLMEILSEGYERRSNPNLQPLVDLDYFLSKSKNLVVMSGGNNSLLFDLLLSNKEKANEYANLLKVHAGSNYFIELHRVGGKNEADYINLAVNLASEQQIPVIATNNVRFMEKSDYETHEIRAAIQSKQTLRSSRQGDALYSPEQYLKSQEEMKELFKDIPSAITNTVAIAKKCNFEMKLGEIDLPPFPVEEGYDDGSYLEKLAKEGLEERLQFLFPDENVRNERRQEYVDRLNVEIGVINNMGFPGYFLIVMEFIQWSKDNDIPVGPGRGSGAGSLVAYALKITDLDPLEYDLLFERFLNPERVSMPDFDIDFCQTGRDKVIAHVAEFYGKQAVSQIITFGTMAAKSVVKDVTRVLGYPYMLGDRISKLIPNKPGIKLADAIKSTPALEMLVQEDPQIAEIIKHALKLEGLVRQVGKHAGGVVISPTTISAYSATYSESNASVPVSQFDKDDVEKRGLVKFDFLGLKTLTVIKRALDLANIQRQKDNLDKLESAKIPLNDHDTYKILQDGNTTGVFQLESSGMKNLVKRLDPETFEEIIALVALYRPGPLDAGMVDTFINCKKGIEEIHYPHPSLEQILDVTNGVFVYQEQVMQAAQIMAKYSLGEADLLRRAMGKKKPEEMAKQRVMFTEGSVANGVNEDDAKHVFDLMETFAGYGFNKSHSASYAVLSVVTAYLKAHYPAPFYAANLTFDADDTGKVVKLIHDARENGVTITPPCINKSLGAYDVNENGDVTFGLASIDGVGDAIREKIIDERDRGGEFTDMFDFMVRANPNIKVVKSCIYSGAFDVFGESRAEMHSYVEEVVVIHKKYKDKIKALLKKDDIQQDLLEETSFDILNTYREQFLSAREEHSHDNVITPIQLIKEERKRLGLYMSAHPTDAYADEIKSENPNLISNILDLSGEDVLKNEKEQNGQNVVTIVGAIVDIDIKNQKKGQTCALTIDDGSGQKTIRLNAKLFNEVYHLIELDEILSIKTHISYNPNSERFWFRALSIKDIEMIRQQNVTSVMINIDLNNPIKKEAIKELLTKTPKGTFKIKVKNTGSPDNKIHAIGEGRDIDDLFLQKVANISDVDNAYSLEFKSKISNIDRKAMRENMFSDTTSDIVESEIKRANVALREAQEIMGLSV